MALMIMGLRQMRGVSFSNNSPTDIMAIPCGVGGMNPCSFCGGMASATPSMVGKDGP